MAEAFRLDVGGGGLATLTFDLPGKRVNIFNPAVVEELERTVADLPGRRDISCLVLLSGKPGTFIAGADVEAIARVTDPREVERAVRAGQALFAAWEALPFPTVAAISGVCLGGGTEIALASTYRVASDRADVRIGLPETRIGILPAWGGSTRLPRLIGLTAALDIILAGKAVSGRSALKMGLVDALLPDARFFDRVRDFALSVRDTKKRTPRKQPWKAALLDGNPLGRRIVYAQAAKQLRKTARGNYPAPEKALEVVRVGLEEGKPAGFEAEARGAGELAVGPVAKNLLHLFFLTEEAKKDKGIPDVDPRSVHATAVVGAGVMGGGIAQLIAHEAGLPVRMKDVRVEALALGMAHARQLFDRMLKRRRITRPEVQRKLALLEPTLDYSGFERADLVVEAVVEKLEVKQEVFREIAAHAAPGAVLASNTSSLSIAEIRQRTPQPDRVVGMHFFNPVDKMPLVEVIVPEGCDPAAANAVFALTRTLGKTPVLVRDTPGFLVNRLLMFYSTEALWLLDEGHKIEDLDRAMTDWGMPVGPIELTDEVGIDVAVKVAHILQEAFSDRLPLPAWLDRLLPDDRLGAKNGRGLYLYENGKRTGPDPSAYRLLGLSPRVLDPRLPDLAERMVLPMVNEAARCLDEEVVADAGHLDLALIFGTGFPPFRGGLCRWADQQGLPRLIEKLERLAQTAGERHLPNDALRRYAAAGGFYAGTKMS
ncbi:MAG TPA: 3-hydroxyacyl-CoA dehydrogenase NAD-binding domain-containing protein [Thermoanaerobaculia bacterium]|nr:3-hydroxyacyl-CoA dehydrogenase NAD-binding domain-containing protein [Thermoanaerobaculia bacterium]